jgi:2-oxoglutarate ferredoxin oxidoreductase subunit delta
MKASRPKKRIRSPRRKQKPARNEAKLNERTETIIDALMVTKKTVAAIIIDNQFCKGCNLCLQVCPKKLFAQGEKRSRLGYRMPEVKGVEECSACLLCEMTCPDFALTVVWE